MKREKMKSATYVPQQVLRRAAQVAWIVGYGAVTAEAFAERELLSVAVAGERLGDSEAKAATGGKNQRDASFKSDVHASPAQLTIEAFHELAELLMVAAGHLRAGVTGIGAGDNAASLQHFLPYAEAEAHLLLVAQHR